MKKIYFIILLAIGSNTFSQLQIHWMGQPVGSSIAIDSADASIDHFLADMHIVNTATVADTVFYSRYRWHNCPGWTDQICDDLLCFNAADITLWERPNTPYMIVAAGDSTAFQLKVYPEGINCCAIYSYYVKDRSGNIDDTVQVTYTLGGAPCSLDIEDEKLNLEYSIYPNPAAYIVNVSVTNSGVNDILKVYNVLGKEVKRIVLTDGLNELNVANLNNGVYFYSLFRDNEIIETKKLIIRH